MFINELHLYIEHLEKFIETNIAEIDNKKEAYINGFKEKLTEGIRYYENLAEKICKSSVVIKQEFSNHLLLAERKLLQITANPELAVCIS